MMRIYLDNDVASTISRRDREDLDLAAMDKLLELMRSPVISIVTSRQSPREMEQAPTSHQEQLKGGLRDIELVPDDHRALGSYTVTDSYGG